MIYINSYKTMVPYLLIFWWMLPLWQSVYNWAALVNSILFILSWIRTSAAIFNMSVILSFYVQTNWVNLLIFKNLLLIRAFQKYLCSFICKCQLGAFVYALYNTIKKICMAIFWIHGYECSQYGCHLRRMKQSG